MIELATSLRDSDAFMNTATGEYQVPPWPLNISWVFKTVSKTWQVISVTPTGDADPENFFSQSELSEINKSDTKNTLV